MNKELLERTQYVVEATDFEVMCLFCRYSKESMFKSILSKYTWNGFSQGSMVNVGEFSGAPVNVCCTWVEINGVVIMFYTDISMIVHHGMIQDWMHTLNLPKTNAMNFHNVIDFIDQKKEK